jgi:hypothetical protein
LVDLQGDALTYDGRSWSTPDNIADGGDLTSVSCATAKFCAAVDDDGNVLTYDGHRWSSPDSIDPTKGNLTARRLY